jgi:hypothetical protein
MGNTIHVPAAELDRLIAVIRGIPPSRTATTPAKAIARMQVYPTADK